MKKNLWAWLLYDAANSFPVTAVGGLFLAQWIIIDKGFNDVWYGAASTLSTIVLLVISPVMGAWSDQIGRRMPFIKGLTYLLLVCNLLMVLIPTWDVGSNNQVYLMLFVYFAFQLFLQLSLIVYNALLPVISRTKERGKITGLGDAFGNGGWILGTALFMPFAQGKITIFGPPGRTQVFLPALILFILLALPMIFGFKETPPDMAIMKQRVTYKLVVSRFWLGLKNLFRRNRNVAKFLIAFSFISDAILTLQLYFAIVLDRLYGATEGQKFLCTLIMFFFMILGGYLLGKLSDKFGCKKIVMISLIILALIFAAAFTFPSTVMAYLLASIAGVAWGGFYVGSRAMLTRISPPKELGEYFGFYTTFWRFASIVGPTLWGGVLILTGDLGISRYQWAGYAMVAMIIIGIYLFKDVQDYNPNGGDE